MKLASATCRAWMATRSTVVTGLLWLALSPMAQADVPTSTDPAPAGATPATMSVSAAGAMTISVPIQVPPGTAGLQPQLALAYDSQAGNGLLGVGWSVEGLSSIARCPRTLATDGIAAGVALTWDDRYCLDGERLIAVSGSDGGNATEYRTEIESDTKVVSYGSAGNGPAYFRVWFKGGRVADYGSTESSRIEAQGASSVLVWALAHVQDRKGNYYDLTYNEDNTNGFFAPARIDYTGHSSGQTPYASVRFAYAGRPDIETSYVAGSVSRLTLALTAVRTYLGETLVRDYRLDYAGNQSPATGRSRLKSVTECADGNVCLAPVQFSWLGPQHTLTLSTAPTPLDARGTLTDRSGFIRGRFLDVNGDGRADYCSDEVVQYPNHAVHCLLATETGWGGFIEKVLTNYSEQLGSWVDFDGDGRLDYCSVGTAVEGSFPNNKSNSILRCRLNNGATLTGDVVSGVVDYGPLTTTVDEVTRTTIAAWWVDVDGDGRADFCRITSHASAPNRMLCTLSAGTSFGATYDLGAIARSSEGGGVWIDLDPDGSKAYCRNVGTNLVCSPARLSGFGPSFTLASATALNLTLRGDINGDGRTDFCKSTYTVGSTDGVMNCFLGTGAGWVAMPATILLGTGSPVSPALTDLNADGRADLCWSFSDGTQARMRCLLSQGESFAGSFASDIVLIDGRFGDAAGSGIASAWALWQPNGVTDVYMKQYAVPAGPRDVINAMTDSLGAQSQVDYEVVTRAAVHTPGAWRGYPTNSAVPTLFVAKTLRLDDGIGGWFSKTLSYTGLRRDQRGRGGLGFETRTLTESTTGVTTTWTHRQDYPFIGLVASKTVIHGPRHVSLSTEGSTWVATALGGTRHRVTKDGTSTRALDANGAFMGHVQTVVSARDAYGSPTRTEARSYRADGSAEGYVQVNETGYRNDTANWLLGLPVSAVATQSLPDGSSQARSQSMDYDADGYLKQVVVEPANGGQAGVSNLRAVVDVGHDTRGNRVSLTTSGATVASRTVTYSYDAIGHLLSGVSLPNGLSVGQQVDGRFGVLTGQQDANGVSTGYGLDAFGRVQSTSYPDGTLETTTWRRCAGCWKGSAMYAESSHVVAASGAQASPTTRLYLDRLGRGILSQVQGFDGRLSHVETEYSVLDRVARESAPYFFGDAVYWASYEYLDDAGFYDPFGRASRVTRADGATTRWAHNGLVGTVTSGRDASGNTDQTTRTELNSQGQTLRITNALGTPDEGSVSFTYTPFGEVATTTDALGNVIRLTHDLRGRNTDYADPNLGTWHYVYDELSQLRSQTDAKGQVTTLDYDVLGRLTARTDADSRYTWAYDSCANGKGALCSVNSPAGGGGNGYARSYSRDAIGRLVASTLTSDATYTTGYGYDAAGRATTVSYPTGFVLQRDFNGYGYLAALRNASTGASFWQANARDAAGALQLASLGNGLRNGFGFEANTGRPSAIQVGTAASPGALFNQALGYDLMDNLVQRTDAASGLTENFGYDNLNRLTSTSVVGGPAKLVFYNAIGNVTSKSDVGNYSYNASGSGSVRPAAVAGIGGTLNGVANPGFSYDANGNLLSGAGRSYTWMAANLPGTVSANGRQLSWLYDEAGQRIRETVSQGGTTQRTVMYLEGLEKETKAGVTEYRHYLQGEGGTVAVYVTRSDGTSATRYLHRDAMGSVAVITDASGNVIERLGYDAFGQRRNANGSDAAGLAGVNGARGYTDHEHLDEVGLVHMNGRLYDAQLNRFVSADPYLQAPGYSQGANRYQYAWGNPLAYTDPSGFGNNGTMPSLSDGNSFSSSMGFAGALSGSFGSRVEWHEVEIPLGGPCVGTLVVPTVIGRRENSFTPQEWKDRNGTGGKSGFDQATARAREFFVGRDFSGNSAATNARLCAGGAMKACTTGAAQGRSGNPGSAWAKGPDMGATVGEVLSESMTNAVPGEAMIGALGKIAKVLPKVAKSAEEAADAARAAGRTSGAAAELRVGDRVFTDVSTGGAARTLHPEVQAALDRVPQAQRAPWHGHCAEPGCLSQALNAGVNPAGGTSRAINIGKSGRGHGTLKPACSSCANVLDQFGVKP